MAFCPQCKAMRIPGAAQSCRGCGSTEPPREPALEDLDIKPTLSLEEQAWIAHRLRQMAKQEVWEVPGRRMGRE